jgi:hypothetical protein
MRARLVRGAIVASLVLLMAVTPLSAVLSGGGFETTLAGRSGVGATRVILDDHTGLVRGIAPARPAPLKDGVSPVGTDGHTLLVQWLGGCKDPLTVLTFDRVDDRYTIVERTVHRCTLLVGIARAITVSLWASIDASAVTFLSHHDASTARAAIDDSGANSDNISRD